MKTSFNPTPKNLREKKRYVLIDKKDMHTKNSISEQLLNLYGIEGFAKMSIKFEKAGVIKVNLDYLDKLMFAINYTNLKENINIKVIKISGTIEGLELDG